MLHNANKVLMGSTRSSYKEVSNHIGSIEAGKVVRLKSDDTLSLAKADGELLGVSLGKDLSDIGRTAIVRKGLGVPMLLTAAFNPTVGAAVHISDTTGLAIAAGAGATQVNATYVTGRLTVGGIGEDGTEGKGVAIIDFPGGL